MSKRKVAGLNIALLDILTGALGAVIILYVAVPKGVEQKSEPKGLDKTFELKYTKLKNVADQQSSRIEAEEAKNTAMKIKIKDLISQVEKLKEEKQKMAQQQANSENIAKEQNKNTKNYRGQGLPVDVGFKFKGKNILFIIDVSGSMIKEDRIGQVKAGLKMLITGMPADYKLDIVRFPGSQRLLYKSMWGKLRNLESFEKDQVYNFLLSLRPRGATPTWEALSFGLRNYKDLSDIVLLSDGAPSAGLSSKVANISQILIDVKRLNRKKEIRINTIGVGSDFVKYKDSQAYVFLKELAKDHGGFFYGF